MLKIQHLCKSFPLQAKAALHNFSLNLEEGEFCIIVGSNGSGKSTLFKSLSGEQEITQGKISLENVDITSYPMYERAKYISTVTQHIDSGTISQMTILENMALSFLRGEKGRFASLFNHRQKISKVISPLDRGLASRLDDKMASLSGGQRQMIATIMALAKQPKLLLLDEHTSALDTKAAHQLLQYTAQKIKEHGITTLMITHHLEDAIHYGDRIIVLNQGKIVADIKGDAKASLTQEKLLSLFFSKQEVTHAF